MNKVFSLGFPWQTQDPFLFCVYHLDHYPEGNEEMGPKASLEGRILGNDFTVKDGWRMYHGTTVPGFPMHPHTGFETITIVNQGFCDHADSLGAAGRFGNGDVQWMTAGEGVQHSEMFPLLNQDRPNTLELFQIWLNLPAKSKKAAPHFKMLWKEEIPIVEEGGVTLQLIAGSYGTEKAVAPPPDSWAADPENQVQIWVITCQPNSRIKIPACDQGVVRSLFCFEGNQAQISDESLEKGMGIELSQETHQLTTGKETCKFLLLQGRKIEEPVVQQGPFVMNSPQEIQRAFEEYRLTRFGGWPWQYPDQVHEKQRGRFARYPDGKIVEKA